MVDAAVEAIAALTAPESEKLARLESVIEAGVVTFKRVGLALMEIRDRELYRATHGRFEEYLIERWGWHKSHTHRLIEAAQAATRVETSPVGEVRPKPTSERQVRPLTKLEPEAQPEAWQRAVDIAGGEQPTAKQVEAAVVEVAAAKPELVRERVRNVREALTSSESADWYSPGDPIDAARALMGGIDLDPASSPEANEMVRASAIFTREDDGLTRPWPGRVWLNWPGGRNENHESNAALWSTKLLAEYATGVTTEAVCLVFNCATGNAWWQPFWRHSICFPRGRLRFRRPGGELGDSPVHSIAVVYLGPRVEQFRAAFAHLGQIVISSPGGVSVAL